MIKRRLSTMFTDAPALLFAACVFSFSALLPAGAAPAKTSMCDAIEMDQNHYFFGHSLTTFTRDAIKIQNLGNFKFVLVSKAPDWTVYVYRSDEKKYFSESLKDLVNTGLVNNYLISEKNLNSGKFHLVRSPMKFQGFDLWRDTCGPATVKVFQLKGYPTQLEAIDHAAMRMPTNGGLAVDYRALDQTHDFFGAGKINVGGVQIYFSTRSIAAKKVSADFFDAPRGYKKAISLREVVAGENVRKDSEEFLLDTEASPVKQAQPRH